MDCQDDSVNVPEPAYAPRAWLSKRTIAVAVLAAFVGAVLGAVGFSWMSQPPISPFTAGI